jgi:hypothetical protein
LGSSVSQSSQEKSRQESSNKYKWLYFMGVEFF